METKPLTDFLQSCREDRFDHSPTAIDQDASLADLSQRAQDERPPECPGRLPSSAPHPGPR